MKKIIACAFAGLLGFAACETTMGMNVNNNGGINVTNDAGQTPLHLAAKAGNYEIVRMFLSTPDVDPNIQDNYGHSALHYAIEKANAEERDIETALELIGDRRVDINNEPILSTAIFCRNITIIEALLVRPDIDLSGKYSRTIISEALNLGNPKILNFLLFHPYYKSKAQAVALLSIAEHYVDRWDEKSILKVLYDPRVDLNGIVSPEGWWCPPFIQLVLEYKNNLKLFKLTLQNPKIDLNKKFFPLMSGPEVEKMFDKIEHVSPFEFLIDKFNGNKESEIKDNIEYLSRLFLFRKMAPRAMLMQDVLQQWASEEYPDLVESELWNNIIDIAYGNKPELSMFSLLISNDDAFNVSNEMKTFRFHFLKSLVDRLCFFKEFAPKQAELQQWVNEKYHQFAASEAWQQALKMLYGSQQD